MPSKTSSSKSTVEEAIPSRAVNRSLQILSIVALHSQEPMKLAEIIKLSALPKSTVHRLLPLALRAKPSAAFNGHEFSPAGRCSEHRTAGDAGPQCFNPGNFSPWSFTISLGGLRRQSGKPPGGTHA